MLKKIISAILLTLLFICSGTNYVYAQSDISKIDNLVLNLHNAYFQDFSVDNLNLTTNFLDFNSNKISDLYVKIRGIHSKDIILDELDLLFKDIYLDIKSLIAKRDFALKQPLQANVTIIATEKTLNQLISNPVILNNLSNLATTKISKLGIDLGSGMISFKDPKIKILPNNSLELNLVSSFANTISYPVSLTTKLAIQNSNLVSISPKLSSYGITLPQNISDKLNDQINGVLDFKKKLGKNFEVKMVSIQTVPNNRIIITAETTINKLKLGKSK